MSGRFEVIWIDQAPLLNEAVDECQKAFRMLESLRFELHRFETQDLAAYDRWIHATFGRYMTRARDLSTLIQQKESHLSEIRRHHWAQFFGSSRHMHSECGLGKDVDGYADGEAISEDAKSEFRAGSNGRTKMRGRFIDDTDGDDAEEFEDEPNIFEAKVEFEDFDEDIDWDREDAQRWFEELLSRGSSWRRGEANSGRFRTRCDEDASDKDRAGFKDRSRGGAEIEVDSVEPAKDSLQSRLKERYRLLVRKLHPDLNPDLTAEKKLLWCQVQAAYHGKNLDQLDLLVAMADAYSGEINSSEKSLDQLRRVVLEIERLLAPLRRKVDEARKNRAWMFSEIRDRSPLKQLIEAEYQRELAQLRETLVHLDLQIARFSRRGSSIWSHFEDRV